MNRRQALKVLGNGFGAVGLSRILAEASPSAESIVYPWASFPSKGEARHLPVLDGWAVTYRHLRSKAHARQVSRQTCAGRESADGAPHGESDEISVQL